MGGVTVYSGGDKKLLFKDFKWRSDRNSFVFKMI